MIDANLLRGALEIEHTPHGLLPHRLPSWALAQAAAPHLAMVEAQPSGVRLAFRTTATLIELDTLPTRVAFTGAPAAPDGAYDLLIDGALVARRTADGGDTVAIDMATGAMTHRPGEVATLRFDGLPAGEKDVEIWLPYRERTELRDLRADAPIAPAAESGRRVWLHHGSSISHGSNTDGPSATWPALAARAGGVELINLGLGGNALLDPFTARVIRDTPADLISVKIGINVVNADLMRLRAFGPAVHGFLDTIREGHPAVPLLVVSPILCPIHEETPGPGDFDPAALAEGRMSFRATGSPDEVAAGKLTLRVIRAELARIVADRAASDPHLRYLDGLELYGEADAEALPLPDALHPDAETHRLIGTRFADRAFGDGGAFGRA
ncbi:MULTISPECIES: GDSL-type esterase/lipase family protein [Catenuloplanes]|uniref:SGNH hydrolase-type esterase domain-containing protein n=1 Tax=Catenuloplanes niger TaxID=587534 RepID=A0AAE3ZXT1_9ACTN|nr:GDSL-type esterase/lipase family protein [Catenuloplanes niger]MDR7326078.1 hypothetical protein [Catenuloplanes niger]